MPPGVFKKGTTTSVVSARGPRLAGFVVASALGACGGPPPPEAPPSPLPPAAPGAHEALTRFGSVALANPPGTLVLYDPERWRAMSAGSFTLLEHPGSRSTLAVRVWRAARLVRPAQCEAEARLARPELPRIDPDSVVDSRPLAAPREFSGTLVVGVEPDADGATRGFALAVGAAVGRCYVLAFDTRATGAGAANTVAERLRTAADTLIPSVELRQVDERVQPERAFK